MESAIDRVLQRDRAAVTPPPNTRHTPDQLHQVIRLLAVAITAVERQIVLRRLYHQQTFADAADAMKLPAGRVREMMNSLLVRERNAIAHQRREERLAALDAAK